MKQLVIPKEIRNLVAGDVRQWGSSDFKLVMFLTSRRAVEYVWPGITVTYLHQDGFTFNITYSEFEFTHEIAYCLVS